MAVPIATYTQHEKAVKHLPARRADEYAAFFGITPEYLLYGRGGIPRRVAVFYDGSGADTGRTAAMPPKPSELTAALEGPTLERFGLVAVYNQPQTDKPPPDVYGRLCVVALASDGGERRLIRIVTRGLTEGRFHLIGFDPPLIDQDVLWIAPVVALVPG